MRRPLILAALLACSGCIEESPLAHQGTPRAGNFQPKAGSGESASSAAPASSAPASPQAPAQPQGNAQAAKPAGAVFDNVLQLVAYKIDPPTAAPGATVTVTVFLRVLAPVPTDEMMFVHVDDAAGRPVRANGDHWPAGHKLPMPQWKVGEVVTDQFQVTLNGFEESQAATVWLGFYDPQRDVRMTITNAQQVKTDGNNRYALADIPIQH